MHYPVYLYPACTIRYVYMHYPACLYALSSMSLCTIQQVYMHYPVCLYALSSMSVCTMQQVYMHYMHYLMRYPACLYALSSVSLCSVSLCSIRHVSIHYLAYVHYPVCQTLSGIDFSSMNDRPRRKSKLSERSQRKGYTPTPYSGQEPPKTSTLYSIRGLGRLGYNNLLRRPP